MADKDAQISKGRPQQPDARAARLKAALKANLARRKAQARARAVGPDKTGPDQTDPSRTEM